VVTYFEEGETKTHKERTGSCEEEYGSVFDSWGTDFKTTLVEVFELAAMEGLWHDIFGSWWYGWYVPLEVFCAITRSKDCSWNPWNC
jgi:hypothetical protein